MEDYETEVVEVWPDNEAPLRIFERAGARWRMPSMGGTPYGLDWPSNYPLMDRADLDEAGSNDLHDALMVMERQGVATMREFAPKPEGG